MNTCKYCGQKLRSIGARDNVPYYACSFCEMEFAVQETCVDRKRLAVIPEYLDHSNIYQTTQQFLERDTITLYHVLKEIRSFWYNLKTLLEKAKKQLNGDVTLKNALEDMMNEYRVLTKKKFVVENIILERTGFLPEKLTEAFLESVLNQGLIASSKKMTVYIQ
jgi:hypothetical protein